MKWQALKYQVSRQMWCPGCEELLDVESAVSLDFIGVTTGKLHATTCVCGKCRKTVNIESGLAAARAKAREEIRLEETDGAMFDEDGRAWPVAKWGPESDYLTRHKTGVKVVRGYQLEIEGWGNGFFGYQNGNEGWAVVEVTTGYALMARHGSRDKAAVMARVNLEKAGLEKFQALVKKVGPIPQPQGSR